MSLRQNKLTQVLDNVDRPVLISWISVVITCTTFYNVKKTLEFTNIMYVFVYFM